MSTSSVERFINEACERTFDALTPAGEMFEAYRKWCFERGIERVGVQPFAQELIKLGIFKINKADRGYYEHVRLLQEAEVGAAE